MGTRSSGRELSGSWSRGGRQASRSSSSVGPSRLTEGAVHRIFDLNGTRTDQAGARSRLGNLEGSQGGLHIVEDREELIEARLFDGLGDVALGAEQLDVLLGAVVATLVH